MCFDPGRSSLLTRLILLILLCCMRLNLPESFPTWTLKIATVNEWRRAALQCFFATTATRSTRHKRLLAPIPSSRQHGDWLNAIFQSREVLARLWQARLAHFHNRFVITSPVDVLHLSIVRLRRAHRIFTYRIDRGWLFRPFSLQHSSTWSC